MKTLILSDMHMGVSASRASGWLDGIRQIARHYDRVILNGDTLDRYEKAHCEPHSAGVLQQVREACHSSSGEAELITGNHDPAISTCQWIYEPHSATLIFHGDCIADWTHPTRLADQMLAARFRKVWAEIGGRPARFVDLITQYRRTQGEFLLEHPPIREKLTALRYLAKAFYPPLKPLHVLGYWKRAPHLAAALAEGFEHPVRHAVVGHTHRAGAWNLRSLRVLNTGSFMPLSKTFAACIDGSTVTLRPLPELLQSGQAISFPSAQPAANKQAVAGTSLD